jgi:hypothetical protein
MSGILLTLKLSVLSSAVSGEFLGEFGLVLSFSNILSIFEYSEKYCHRNYFRRIITGIRDMDVDVENI